MSSFTFEFEQSVGDLCVHVPTWDLEYLTHISPSLDYLYVESPKAGCTLVKSVLHQIALSKDPNSQAPKNVHSREESPLLVPSQVPSYRSLLCDQSVFKFCFVRNPYTRLLSAYLDKIVGGREQKLWVLLQLGLDPTAYEYNITFEMFVEAVCAQPVSFMDIHWRPQYYQTFKNGIDYDFAGKFETLHRDLSEVLIRLDQSPKGFESFFSKTSAHATGANGKVAQYYSFKTERMVYRKFQYDFEVFGYSKRLPC